ncbi:N-6 DNA methylase [Streptomyces smyrnaeus]|uniref:N-6 DNA methylase n=1 Tax=Streptomyces smyrnaeus TaxID=1387713 RepID=UPI0033DF42A4
MSYEKASCTPERPDAAAVRIAAAVARTWYGQMSDQGSEVPLGVVATLAQVRSPQAGVDPAEQLLPLSPARLWEVLERVWARQWATHPELVHWARRVHGWLRQAPTEEQAKAVHAVVHTALEAGLLELTDHADAHARSATDVLGPLLSELRGISQVSAVGEYHSPPDVTALAERLTAPDLPEPGAWLMDPVAGTGGMARAMASRLREAGRGPEECAWYLIEVDAVAAACCAANALVWHLGPHVLVQCADTLQNPDWKAALAERQAVRARMDEALAAASLASVTKSAAELLGSPPPFLHR